eukprot:2388481-Prymnesium_polylepis.1
MSEAERPCAAPRLCGNVRQNDIFYRSHPPWAAARLERAGRGPRGACRRGPAVGTWRSEVSSQRAFDPRKAASQDVGRAVRPDRAS